MISISLYFLFSTIDIKDFNTFSSAWQNQDLDYELGPITGEVPFLTTLNSTLRKNNLFLIEYLSISNANKKDIKIKYFKILLNKKNFLGLNTIIKT